MWGGGLIDGCMWRKKSEEVKKRRVESKERKREREEKRRESTKGGMAWHTYISCGKNTQPPPTTITTPFPERNLPAKKKKKKKKTKRYIHIQSLNPSFPQIPHKAAQIVYIYTKKRLGPALWWRTDRGDVTRYWEGWGRTEEDGLIVFVVCVCLWF
jgi:hypothetical protein